MRRSYLTKFLLTVISLVLIVQLATYMTARSVVRNAALDSAREALRVGGDTVTQLLFNKATQLEQSSAALTRDKNFRSAIANNDANAIRSTLHQYVARTGANYAAVITESGLVVNIQDQSLDAEAQPAALETHNNHLPLQISMIGNTLYELVTTPIYTPAHTATASMGFAITASLATDIKQLTGLEVSFVSLSTEGNTALYISTLPETQATLLPSMPFKKQRPANHRTDDSTQFSLLGDKEMLTLSWRLDNGSRPIYAVLQRPLDDILSSYTVLTNRLLFLNLASVLIAIVVAIFLASGITGPIRAIANATRRISGGDYSSQVKPTNNREFGDLAHAFNAMQQAIGEREQRILVESRLDPLTGLGNRSTAHVTLVKTIRSAASMKETGEGEGSCAVLTIDLQRFKEINDVFGHQAGDSLLQIVALRLLGSVKEVDEVIRLGADVFLVVLVNVNTVIAMNVAARICTALQQRVELQDLNLSISAHIGVALYPEHGTASEELMRRSDIAMQRAKEGGEQINLYQAGTDEQHLRRLGLLSDLKDALASDGLHMLYQPKAALADHHYVGAEALIRWNHPVLGFQNPEEFIALAESAGYINKLTRWVLNATLPQLGQWHQSGQAIHLSVNISALDLLDHDLPQYLSALLKRYEINPAFLCLELTESSIMRDEQQSLDMLARLKELGVRLSVDDFGTGFSSLSQLKQMPVDELKIDKSFILKLDQNDNDVVIVRSTIELGHNMGLSVVAEGVENQAALNILQQYGCNLVQGYFLGRPMPAAELITWADHRRNSVKK